MENSFFFGWKKLILFVLGNINLPPSPFFFYQVFSFFLKKKHLWWKTIKIFRAFFFSKGYAVFHIFLNQTFYTENIKVFQKKIENLILKKGGFFFLFASFKFFYFAKVVSFFFFAEKNAYNLYWEQKKLPFLKNQGFFLSQKRNYVGKPLKFSSLFFSQQHILDF